MKLVEITKDDFKSFNGIDLEVEFAYGNYDSENMPEIFINRVQTSLINYLKANYISFENKLALNDNELNEKDKEAFFEALLYQIEFVLKTGKTEEMCQTAYNILKGNGVIDLYG